MQILSPEEIRNAEKTANENGLSYDDMMESAGIGCAEHILKNYPDSNNIVLICGKGKNGGDGFVIARYLSENKKNVSVIKAFPCPSDSLSEKNKALIDGKINIHDGSKLTKNIISLLNTADIIVDAVFGIGFKGILPENIQKLFIEANHSAAVRIAVDIPSGISSESGLADNFFRANETLSMLCFKKEHIFSPYREMCGKVSIIPIGFAIFGNYTEALSRKEIKDILPKRTYDSNKGTYGKALILAGSYLMPGAGIISTKGCLSSGVGLTYFGFPDKIYSTVTSHLTECIFRPLPSDENGNFSEEAYNSIKDELKNFSAVAIGPGLGMSKGAENLVNNIIKNYKGKLILDADGINLISDNINILKESEADILLTPHLGEMSRLIQKSIKEINYSRIESASDFANKYQVNVLLKGANTIITDKNGRVFINPTGSSALSRGGSGDLLTGITVSLAAQGLSAFCAGSAGAYIHGIAGEKAEQKYTAYCATVENICSCLPDALSEIISGK